MKWAKFLLIALALFTLTACGARHVSTLADTTQKSAWIGDEEAILSDIYELCVPYGTVVPIKSHSSKGYIVQSRAFPKGFKTYTMVTALLPTLAKDANGEAVRAYGVNITCENCDLISSGTEEELLGAITNSLDAKYQKASF
ncbi:hypothetical protein LJC36_01070 [Desulfovibrio sp. OttesenSCG-928-C14]|nr:hypothetical protein [Desulfovibrio sp. OttesenSCG-928-C14]